MGNKDIGVGYYMLSVKIKNRSKHSAVAVASYRSDEALFSERDGRTKKYRPHSVPPINFILAPLHAPEWATNRERLWNEVEKVEYTPNAQLQREVLLALPVELDDENQEQMVKEFVQQQFVDEGMVADVSIHRNRHENPHAHVTLTMRAFDEKGNWMQKRKRVPKLDKEGNPIIKPNGKVETVSVATNDWGRPGKLVKWRKEWANILNEYAKKNDVSLTYSEKSFTGQDIEKMPLIRMNRESYYIEKMAKEQAKENNVPYLPVTEIGKQNAMIEEINQSLTGSRKQLVSIEDRLKELKYTNQKQMLVLYGIDEFNKINPLNEKQRDSYKAIKRRTNQTVDYGVAKQLQKDLINGSWKKKIDAMKSDVQSLKTYINSSLAPAFKKDEGREFSISVGIPEARFKEYYNEKIKEYNDKLKELKTNSEARKSLLEKTETVIQRETIKNERLMNIAFDFELADESFKTPEGSYVALKNLQQNGSEVNIVKPIESSVSLRKQKDQLHILRPTTQQVLLATNRKLVTSYKQYLFYSKNIHLLKTEGTDNDRSHLVSGDQLYNFEQQKLSLIKIVEYRKELDHVATEVIREINSEKEYTLGELIDLVSGDKAEFTELYGDIEKLDLLGKETYFEQYANDNRSIGSEVLGGLLNSTNSSSEEDAYKRSKKKKKKKDNELDL